MKNTYTVSHKDADDKTLTNYREAVKIAKKNAAWNHPVTVKMNDKTIHIFEVGYDNYIFDKLAE